MYRYVAHLYLFLCLLASSEWAASTPSSTVDSQLIDPTRPIGYSSFQKQNESLKLQAIFWGGGRKEAIINGVAVKEGSSVGGKKIISIKKNEVMFESSGVIKVLKLRPSIFDK